MMRYCAILSVSLSFLALSLADHKHWLPDLEWRTASNWEQGLMPEMDGHVVFPIATRHAVGLAKSDDLRLSEIDLPREGSLVLFRDGKLEVSDSVKSKGKVARWAREGRFFWADPENWSIVSAAAPHLDRVPCADDDVILPRSDHTMNIVLPVMEVQVRSIRLEDQNVSFASFEWESLENRREFSQGRVSIGLHDAGCRRCQCGRHYKDYLEEICALERPRCGFTDCEYPLKIDGHCCFYCGAKILLPSSLSLSVVRVTVDTAFERYKNQVYWYVRRGPAEEIEILIKEVGGYTGIESLEAAEVLQQTLRGDGMQVLGMWTTGAAVADARLALALGTFFGWPPVVCVFLLVVLIYFGYSVKEIFSTCSEAWLSVHEGVRSEKPRTGKPFSFARFENISEGNVEIAGAAERVEQVPAENVDDAGEESTGGRFENPLYRSKRGKKQEEPNILDADATLSLATLKDAVEGNVEEIEMDIE